MTEPTPQQGPGQYAYAPPQPPKKKHTVRNVILVLLALGLAGIAGCAALLGSAAESVDDALDEEAKHDKPTKIDEGTAFDHDIWAVSKGWKVKAERFTGDAKISGLRAELTGDTADTPMLTFQLMRGKNVLATIDCTGDRVQPGQSVRLSCISTDKMPKRYQRVTVRDSW